MAAGDFVRVDDLPSADDAEVAFRSGRVEGGARDSARLRARPRARPPRGGAAPRGRQRRDDRDDRHGGRRGHRAGDVVRARGAGFAERGAAGSRAVQPGMRSAYNMVSGVIVLILAMVASLLASLTIAREWERGSMEQLFATPVSRVEIIVGKLIPYAGPRARADAARPHARLVHVRRPDPRVAR